MYVIIIIKFLSVKMFRLIWDSIKLQHGVCYLWEIIIRKKTSYTETWQQVQRGDPTYDGRGL